MAEGAAKRWAAYGNDFASDKESTPPPPTPAGAADALISDADEPDSDDMDAEAKQARLLKGAEWVKQTKRRRATEDRGAAGGIPAGPAGTAPGTTVGAKGGDSSGDDSDNEPLASKKKRIKPMLTMARPSGRSFGEPRATAAAPISSSAAASDGAAPKPPRPNVIDFENPPKDLDDKEHWTERMKGEGGESINTVLITKGASTWKQNRWRNEQALEIAYTMSPEGKPRTKFTGDQRKSWTEIEFDEFSVGFFAMARGSTAFHTKCLYTFGVASVDEQPGVARGEVGPNQTIVEVRRIDDDPELISTLINVNCYGDNRSALQVLKKVNIVDYVSDDGTAIVSTFFEDQLGLTQFTAVHQDTEFVVDINDNNVTCTISVPCFVEVVDEDDKKRGILHDLIKKRNDALIAYEELKKTGDSAPHGYPELPPLEKAFKDAQDKVFAECEIILDPGWTDEDRAYWAKHADEVEDSAYLTLISEKYWYYSIQGEKEDLKQDGSAFVHGVLGDELYSLCVNVLKDCTMFKSEIPDFRGKPPGRIRKTARDSIYRLPVEMSRAELNKDISIALSRPHGEITAGSFPDALFSSTQRGTDLESKFFLQIPRWPSTRIMWGPSHHRKPRQLLFQVLDKKFIMKPPDGQPFRPEPIRALMPDALSTARSAFNELLVSLLREQEIDEYAQDRDGELANIAKFYELAKKRGFPDNEIQRLHRQAVDGMLDWNTLGIPEAKHAEFRARYISPESEDVVYEYSKKAKIRKAKENIPGLENFFGPGVRSKCKAIAAKETISPDDLKYIEKKTREMNNLKTITFAKILYALIQFNYVNTVYSELGYGQILPGQRLKIITDNEGFKAKWAASKFKFKSLTDLFTETTRAVRAIQRHVSPALKEAISKGAEHTTQNNQGRTKESCQSAMDCICSPDYDEISGMERSVQLAEIDQLLRATKGGRGIVPEAAGSPADAGDVLAPPDADDLPGGYSPEALPPAADAGDVLGAEDSDNDSEDLNSPPRSPIYNPIAADDFDDLLAEQPLGVSAAAGPGGAAAGIDAAAGAAPPRPSAFGQPLLAPTTSGAGLPPATEESSTLPPVGSEAIVSGRKEGGGAMRRSRPSHTLGVPYSRGSRTKPIDILSDSSDTDSSMLSAFADLCVS